MSRGSVPRAGTVRGVVAVLLAALAVVVPAACGGGGDDRSRVVLLTHDSFAISDAARRAFESSSGIRLEILRGGDAGAVVNQAVLTAGDPVADVLFGVDSTFLSRALDADLFEPYAAAGAERVAAFAVDDRVTPVDYGDVCVVYDRAWFAGPGRPPPPASLEDLAAPAYRRLTVVEHPATSSPGLAFLLATVAAYGEGGGGWTEYWERLRANDVLVVPGWEAAYQGAFSAGGGGGDRPVVVSYGSSPPADVVFAEEPRTDTRIGVVEPTCFRQVEYAGVLRGAAHGPEARALVDFLVSRRFQEDVPLQMFVFPVDPDARLPEVFTRFAARPADPYRMTPEAIGEHRDEWIARWTDVVVR